MQEGTEAEREFISLRGSNFVRKSTKEEDMNEHWDILDAELGRVDVKAAKRLYRSGPVDYTIWWELKTVKRPPNWQPQKGWGVPNGIDRLIAVRGADKYYLIKPENIIDDLRKRCTEYFRGEFGLHTRPGRGDLMTVLPLWYVIDNAELQIDVKQ
jgi:hypothetical protein